ncbi:MAG: peptidylprolyl isomerase [Deltaproteobacteria bacterium]|nr:peptidylprolyl isomerase [Deltaproteobacteria bacterium]
MLRLFLIFALLLPALNAWGQEQKEQSVAEGFVVSFEYTLSDEKGTLIESNKGKEPLTYTQGKGQIIPGLEKNLTGMKVNQVKKVRVKPEDAYGSVDPKKFREVPREKIPAEAQKAGSVLVAKTPQGEGVPVRVREVKEKTVILDLNHPLAGKTLMFDIKILKIESARLK